MGSATQAMRTGYNYIRCSTSEQRDGHSYERQVQLARKYVAEHNDLVLDTTLDLNDAVSAHKGKNFTSGKLGEFFKAIEDGRVKPGSFLLVESLDRLSRMQPMSALLQLNRFLERGITIVTLNNQKKFTKENINDLGILIGEIVDSNTNWGESDTKTRHSLANWQKRRDALPSGQVLTRNVPKWLRVVRGKIVPIKDRVALVRRMFKMSLDGVGLDSIARRLNEEHVPTWSKGNGWYQGYVNKILRHRGLIGEFVPKSMGVCQEPIPEYYPKVIADDLFYAVQSALTSRTGKGGEIGSYVNLFSHIVKCFHCDGTIIRWNKGKTHGSHTFVCQDGFRGINKCGVKPWKIDEFEQKVLSCVKEVDLAQILGTDTSERVAALHMQMTGGQAKVADTEGRLNALVLALEKGGDVPRIVRRIRQLEQELETLTAQCAITENEYQAAKEMMESSQSKQRDVVELMQVIGDRDVRIKLKQQLAGLIKRIDVDLVQKQMAVFYIGQRPRAVFISPDVSPKMFKLHGVQSPGTG